MIETPVNAERRLRESGANCAATSQTENLNLDRRIGLEVRGPSRLFLGTGIDGFAIWGCHFGPGRPFAFQVRRPAGMVASPVCQSCIKPFGFNGGG